MDDGRVNGGLDFFVGGVDLILGGGGGRGRRRWRLRGSWRREGVEGLGLLRLLLLLFLLLVLVILERLQ